METTREQAHRLRMELEGSIGMTLPNSTRCDEVEAILERELTRAYKSGYKYGRGPTMTPAE